MSQSFDLSLIQANKLLPNLKSLHKQYSLAPPTDKKKAVYQYSQPVAKLSNTVGVTWSTSNPFTEEQFAAQMESQITNVRDKIAFNLEISEDLRNFKSVVFRANIDSGVDQVLSNLELLGERRRIFDSLHKESLKTDKNTIATDLAAVYANGKEHVSKNGALSETFTAYQLAYSSAELVEILGDLTKKIRELETKRDELNSRTKVTLVFHPRVAKLLGL